MRRPVRDYSDDPALQEELRLATQRNSYAAIPQLRLRQLYRNYGAMAARDKKETADFVNRYELKDKDIAESSRRHTMEMTRKRKQLDDALRGAQIGKILGLGSVGLNIVGNKEADEDRILQKQRNDFIMQNYINNATPEGLATMWDTLPEQRNRLRNTPWYQRTFNETPDWDGQE